MERRRLKLGSGMMGSCRGKFERRKSVRGKEQREWGYVGIKSVNLFYRVFV